MVYGNLFLNLIAMVYFEADNSSSWVASKLANPESARALAMARDGIGAQALIHCHTGGTRGNVYFSGCLTCGTHVVNG